jgi:hypothetical protein
LLKHKMSEYLLNGRVESPPPATRTRRGIASQVRIVRMTDKNERGVVHHPTSAKEPTAARFSLEDILEQVEGTGVEGIVGS